MNDVTELISPSILAQLGEGSQEEGGPNVRIEREAVMRQGQFWCFEDGMRIRFLREGRVAYTLTLPSRTAAREWAAQLIQKAHETDDKVYHGVDGGATLHCSPFDAARLAAKVFDACTWQHPNDARKENP